MELLTQAPGNYTYFNSILLKEKGGMRESFPRQVDKESRGPQGERVLEFSRRKKGQTFFSFSTIYNNILLLGLYNNNVLYNIRII